MASSPTEAVCGDCSRTAFADCWGKPLPGCAFVVMAPGRDGKEWHLCARCYNDGRHVRVRNPVPKEPTMVSGEFARALVESGGWEPTDNGDGTMTISPPKRARKKR